jgi:hypothetical protein
VVFLPDGWSGDFADWIGPMTSLNWRLISAAALVSMTAVPAAAQNVADERIAEAAELMADEQTQDRVGRAMQVLTRALLSMPVGELAEAVREIDPDSDMADLPRNARLADLMGDDAEDLPHEMGRQSRTMMRAMSVMTRQMAVLAPALRSMASDLEAQMDRELRGSRRR